MKKPAKNIIRKIIRPVQSQISLHRQNIKLRKFRNIHKDKDCVILGAGPSLKEVPHEFLNKFVVIGTNLSIKYYQPDYWIVLDTQFSWLDEGRKLCFDNKIPVFLNWIWGKDKKDKKYSNEIFLHSHRISHDQSPNNKQLIKQLTNAYNHPKYIEKKGFTSINSVVSEGAIPMANYMGFKRIFLAGVDYYIPGSGKLHFIDDTEKDILALNKIRKNVETEDNTGRDLFTIKKWPYELIKDTKLNGKIFNLSMKSSIINIPKVKYQDVIF